MTKLLPIIIILVLAIGGGYYFYSQQNQGATETKTEAAKTLNKSPKICVVSDSKSTGYEEQLSVMKTALTEMGYTPVYTQDPIADNNFTPAAKKCAEAKADLIVTSSTPATRAAMAATTTIPIVYGGVGDPVVHGVSANVNSSENNTTGVSSLLTETATLRLSFIKTVKPSTKKVAWLSVTNDQASQVTMAAVRRQAEQMGITLVEKTASTTAEAKAIIKTIKGSEVDGISAVGSIFQTMGADMVALQNSEKIVLGGLDTTWTDKGAIFAYGMNYKVTGKQVARIADRVLKGTKPSDMPFERSEKIDLVVNQKAAQAIGITIPQEAVAKADTLIK